MKHESEYMKQRREQMIFGKVIAPKKAVAIPKKSAKRIDEEKEYKKIVEEMLKAIYEQKRSDQWTREGGRFIPNPSTWLNQKRWQDELLPKEDQHEWLR